MSKNVLYKLVKTTEDFETICMSPQVVKYKDEHLFGIHKLIYEHNEIIMKIAIFELIVDDVKNPIKKFYVAITNKSIYQLYSNKYLPEHIMIATSYYHPSGIKIVHSNEKNKNTFFVSKTINEYLFDNRMSLSLDEKTNFCDDNMYCVCVKCLTDNHLLEYISKTDLELINV